jgi:anti-anti-sigma factor
MTAVDAARGQAQVQAEMSLSVLSRPAFTIARLEGDLDIAATPVLRERLLSVLGPGVRLLIIDLSGVTFCDVSALAVLVGTQRRARALGITVRLAGPRPQTAKLLCVTGLDRHFTICAAPDHALPVQIARLLRSDASFILKRKSLAARLSGSALRSHCRTAPDPGGQCRRTAGGANMSEVLQA